MNKNMEMINKNAYFRQLLLTRKMLKQRFLLVRVKSSSFMVATNDVNGVFMSQKTTDVFRVT